MPLELMPTLRVLIADDEPLARLILRQRLVQCEQPQAQVVAEAGNSREVLAALATQTCDVVLLDIRMPGMDGLQLAHQLMARPAPPAVIFVSAHPEHALQAFDVQALDYLTKPVALDRLQQALRRVKVPEQALGPEAGQAPLPAESVTDMRFLTLTDRQRTLRLPLQDIVLARACDKRVVLVTREQEHVTDEPLSDLEPRLGPGFVRVHRGAIVAQAAIRELRHRSGDDGDDAWAVHVMPGDHWVAVSRRQLAAVRAALGHAA